MGGHGKKSHFSINDFFEKWLRKTLWLWLPFYAFFALIQELGHHDKHHH